MLSPRLANQFQKRRLEQRRLAAGGEPLLLAFLILAILDGHDTYIINIRQLVTLAAVVAYHAEHGFGKHILQLQAAHTPKVVQDGLPSVTGFMAVRSLPLDNNQETGKTIFHIIIPSDAKLMPAKARQVSIRLCDWQHLIVLAEIRLIGLTHGHPRCIEQQFTHHPVQLLRHTLRHGQRGPEPGILVTHPAYSLLLLLLGRHGW